MDNLEELVTEAHKAKGWMWVSQEPLWTTWTIEKFGTILHSHVLRGLYSLLNHSY